MVVYAILSLYIRSSLELEGTTGRYHPSHAMMIELPMPRPRHWHLNCSHAAGGHDSLSEGETDFQNAAPGREAHEALRFEKDSLNPAGGLCVLQNDAVRYPNMIT